MKKILTAVFLLTSIVLNAQIHSMDNSGISNTKNLSPYFQIGNSEGEVINLPLFLTKADVEIAGVIADVKITQIYMNKGKKPIEAIYVFPASTKSAVYGMTMTIGKRILKAEINTKEQARKTYEEAKEAGQSASLLEQHRPNIFQMNVANIMPGDSIIVEVKYTELLVPEDKVYEFVFPTVVGPRYSNNEDKEGISNESLDYKKEGEKPDYKFDININLSTGVPIEFLDCSTHEIHIDFIDANSREISLNEEEMYSGYKDFILKYSLAGDKIETGLLLSTNGKENFFLLMLQPPKRIEKSTILPREYVFVVDVSGSMHGYPLEVSKDLMNELFSELAPTDKFNILLFAGSSEMLFEKSQEATIENLNKASNMLSKLRGGGGTELLPALKKVFEYPKDKNFSRSLVVITDGYINVEKEAFELVKNNLDDANLFAFGIGKGVNRYLIEGLARVGQAQSFVVSNQKEAAEKAAKFKKYIQSPIMTDIKIGFDRFEAYDVEPKSIPDVFSERPILIYGKYSGIADGKITVFGYYNSKKYKVDVDVLKFGTKVYNDALKYLWARNRISELSDFSFSARDPEMRKEITDLGLKYNLLTDYTSFVAVDYLKRNDGDSIVTVKQTLPLPEGVSDYALSGRGYASGGKMMMKSAVVMAPGTVASGNNYSIRGSRASETIVKVDGISKTNEFQELSEEHPPLIDLKEVQKKVVYPTLAKRAGIEGKVVLKVLITNTGSVKELSVSYSENAILDSAAIKAVMATKFVPGHKNGNPIDSWVTIPVQFKLEDEEITISTTKEGIGEEITKGDEICITWSLISSNYRQPIIKDSLCYKFSSEKEYQDIDKWFDKMKLNEKRTVDVPSSKINMIKKVLKLKKDYNYIIFEIELTEIK